MSAGDGSSAAPAVAQARTGTGFPFASTSRGAPYEIVRLVTDQVRSPTRISPGCACCWRRAATLTGSPLTISSPRAAASRLETTSPVLTAMRSPTSAPNRSRTWAANAPKRSWTASAARTPRSASSSCACGMPKTARTASPTNFSITPPNRSTSVPMSSKSSPWSTRTSSASSVDPSAVEPARSAKRTVTTRRSWRSSPPAARRGPSCSAIPHVEQNAAPACCSDPQPGHSRCSGAPHSLQKRLPSWVWALHEGHAGPTQRVYGDYNITGCGETPRPVSAAAPQRAAKATASCGSSARAERVREPAP